MKQTVYNFDLAVSYLKDCPLGHMRDTLKNSAINLANAGLTTDQCERARLILEAQSAIFNVTEFLDSISRREVEA